MKKMASLYAAGALVLLANAFTLVHAARNRAGAPSAEITLTDSELSYWREKDDSGVALGLQYSYLYADAFAPRWLDDVRIRALGFDTSVDPRETRAYEHYRRQRSRQAFVAFEFDGPAWRRALEAIPEADRRETELRRGSRLIPVDAALDAAVLDARYAGRKDILILPAVVRISSDSAWPATATRPAKPARLSVSVLEVPRDVHVPLPYSGTFRNLAFTTRVNDSGTPIYHVKLRYGRFREPQVVGVTVP